MTDHKITDLSSGTFETVHTCLHIHSHDHASMVSVLTLVHDLGQEVDSCPPGGMGIDLHVLLMTMVTIDGKYVTGLYM